MLKCLELKFNKVDKVNLMHLCMPTNVIIISKVCFVLITSVFLIEISLASKSRESLYCEIFQNINFDGESLQIPDSQKVNNFTQLTQSWTNAMINGEIQFHSFKLPMKSSSGIICVLNACSSENFNGNCTVFKLSRKIVQSSRLKSFECNCFYNNIEGSTTTANIEPIARDDDSQSHTCEGDIGETSFRNFTKNGKKIIGVGRNYVWHKTDLSKVVGSGGTPDKPIIFLKPTTSYFSEGNLIHLPENLGIIYYELELAVIIGKVAKNVRETDALDYVAGYTIALDMTAKEVLKSSISKGLPWELAKGFDGACPIGNFISKTCIPDPHDLQLSCSINGVLTQNDSTRQMIFKVPQLISYVSQYMTLEPNDVILTGTPDGFGQVQSGDVIEGSIYRTDKATQTISNNLAKIKFVVA